MRGSRANPPPAVASDAELARLGLESSQSVAPHQYATAQNHWEAFCRERNILPWDDSAIDSVVFALWQSWLAARATIKAPKVIKKYVSGIRYHFQLRRMHRALAASRSEDALRHASGVQRQLALNAMEDRTPAIRSLFLSSRRFMTRDLLLQAAVFMPRRSLKDRNIVRVGFAATGGLNRLGELAATNNNRGKVPVAADYGSHPKGLRTLFLARSKTDKLFQGTTVYYPADGSPTSPGDALNDCYYDAHFQDYNPNRPFFCDDFGSPILASDVVAAFRKGLRAAGIPTDGVLGHSFRRGGALDLFNAGVSPERICVAGRWTSNCWKIYVTLSQSSWDCHKHYQLGERLRRARGSNYYPVGPDLELARRIHQAVGASMLHAN